MKYCYLRVSTIEQNLDRQYEAMKKYDIPEENYYVEKYTGRTIDREQLQKLLSVLKEGDILHIHDFSRLSRSTGDLLRIVNVLNERGVTLISNKENLDTSTPTGKLMLTMIGAINEFEVNNNRERALEGIVVAKAAGKYKKKDIDTKLFNKLKKDVDSGYLSVKTAAEELGVSRVTWYKLIKESQGE